MFGINKNGTKHKIGIAMPSFFPSSRTTYDNTQSGLTSTDVQDAIDELAQSGGGSIDIQRPTFTEASTRANIESGETISTLFGKIKKWFSDLSSMFVSKSGDTMSGNLTIDRQNGTTAAEGYSYFEIGNSIPIGTDHNSTGVIRLYSDNGKRAQVYFASATENRNIGFPNKSGLVALTSDLPDISTKVSKSGDTMSGTLTVAPNTDTPLRIQRLSGNSSSKTYMLFSNVSGGMGYYAVGPDKRPWFEPFGGSDERIPLWSDILLNYATPFYMPNAQGTRIRFTFTGLGAYESIHLLIFGRYSSADIMPQCNSAGTGWADVKWAPIVDDTTYRMGTSYSTNNGFTLTVQVGPWSAAWGIFIHPHYPNATMTMTRES